jgi:hypothetical protein
MEIAIPSLGNSQVVPEGIWSSSENLDSGCTDHMICDQSLFTFSKAVNNRTVTHIGKVVLSPDLILDNVLCVPYFQLNLISISKLTLD